MEAVWGRALPEMGKMRFGSCVGEVASPPSIDRAVQYTHSDNMRQNGAVQQMNQILLGNSHGGGGSKGKKIICLAFALFVVYKTTLLVNIINDFIF